MKKNRRWILFNLAVFSIIFTLGVSSVYAYEIAIDVAPNVINIQSESTVVTVHTDIAYNIVDGSTVTLNGVEIDSWKSDDRGNFVAKFLSDEIKALDGLVIGGYNTLKLVGDCTIADETHTFSGTQNIKVIEIFPQGKK